MSETREMIQPLEDRLLVSVESGDVVTKSGILIPVTEDRGYPAKGTVMATGPGAVEQGVLTKMDARVGDEIYFAKSNAVSVDETLSIISEPTVIATVRDGEVSPYWDKVLIELEQDGGQLASGITLLSNKDEPFDRGVVVAVGPGFPKGEHRPPMELNVGDRVVFNQFSGVELDLGMDDMRRLFITREVEVHGVWNV